MKKTILSIIAATALVSCSDEFLDKEPQSTVSNQQIEQLKFEFPEKLLALTQGAEAGNNKYLIQYNTLGSELHDDYGMLGNSLMFDHMGNDLVMAIQQWYSGLYNFTGRVETSTRTKVIWNFNYKVIYNMNSVLDLIPEDTTDSNYVHLRGRALALRANSYFILLGAYANGDKGVPYYSKEIYNTSRVPTNEVYELIEKDLLKAYADLDGFTPDDKQAVTKDVVAGLLSRLYLTIGRYGDAATYANIAKSNYQLMTSNQLLDGFSKISNPEWMWGADIDGATTTSYASFFSHMDSKNEGYAGLLGQFRLIDVRLFDAISSSDIRKQWFHDGQTVLINSSGRTIPKYTNLKFRDDTFMLGDYVYMRAAEMYLNEAEALALSGDESGARRVLFDLVSTRDTAYTLSSNSGSALIDEIRTHRRIELWGEGFSLFDMKRWNIGLERNYPDSNHATFGLFNYPAGSPKLTFQIPIDELRTNSSITDQNPL